MPNKNTGSGDKKEPHCGIFLFPGGGDRENPVIIGERINPTGKSKFKQALRDHNLEYILREGVTQQDHGAHVLM